jgi:hypothetical protein
MQLARSDSPAIVALLFKQVELMGALSRILWKLTFAVGYSYVITIDDRQQLKKMLRAFDESRREFGSLLNDSVKGGEL